VVTLQGAGGHWLVAVDGLDLGSGFESKAAAWEAGVREAFTLDRLRCT
jgi:hypothetical protein